MEQIPLSDKEIANTKALIAEQYSPSSSSKSLNPEHTYNYDESIGKLLSISEKYIVRKGTQVVHGRRKCKRNLLPQSFNFIFGCTGAGGKLPVLIGFRNSKLEQDKLHIVKVHDWNSLFIGSQPCVVVIYNKKTTNLLPKLFRKYILDPTLAELTSELKENEVHVVFEDGGNAEHLEAMEQEDYLAKCEATRQVHFKLHTNSTGDTQICDLIQLFKWIKDPNFFLQKVRFSAWTAMQTKTDAILRPQLQGKIESAKLNNFINTMTVLFNITLPSLTVFQIVEEWRRLGLIPLSLENTLLKCPTIITDETLAGIKAAMSGWVDIFCEESRISDEHLSRVMGTNMYNDLSADGPLREDGLVLKTCKAAHERVLGKYHHQ